MPQYKLMYFDFKALAEPIRFLFHYGGIEFEDYHYTKDEWWNELKQKSPFGLGPLLVIDGEMFTQSNAIMRMLANKIGIAGEGEVERLRIDMIADTIWDVRTMLFSYCFDTKENKAAKEEKLFSTSLPFVMKRLDERVKQNGGYFVGSKLTYPDLQYTSLYEYFCTLAGDRDIEKDCPNLKKLREKMHAIPQIKAYVDKRNKNEENWIDWSF